MSKWFNFFIFSVINFIFINNQALSAWKDVSLLAQNTAQIKVLLFLSHDCPCSRSHVSHLNELQHQYPQMAFFGIITEPLVDDGNVKEKDQLSELSDYYNDKNFTFPLIKDPQQILVKKYAALKTPHVTILQKGKEGQEMIVYQGGISDKRQFSSHNVKYLSENLHELSLGRKVKFATGDSLGCYIRRF